MKKTFLFLILTLTLVLLSSNSEIEPNYNSSISSINRFAFDIYRSINNQESNNSSILISPYNIYTHFSILYSGTENQTRQEFQEVFYINQSDEAFHRQITDFSNNLLESESKSEINIINSLWADDRMSFNQEYLDSIQFYNPELRTVNWSNPSQVAREINSWIEDETDGAIEDLITKQVPGYPFTLLANINAISFHGKWKNKFRRRDTYNSTFRSYDQNYEIRMLYNNELYEIVDYENYSIIKIPYDGYEYSMLIVLPHEDDGLIYLEDEISFELFLDWMAKPSEYYDVELSIPKFEKSYGSIELKNHLINLGLTTVYEQENADFSGIGYRTKEPDNPELRYYLDSTEHQAKIIVDEKGTEATAATVSIGCFPGDTVVSTPNGLKRIDELESGEQVYSYDFNSESSIISKITEKNRYNYSGDIFHISTENETISATHNHPFYLLDGTDLENRPTPSDIGTDPVSINNGRWVEASDLKIGDVLLNRFNQQIVIEDIDITVENTPVYNLEIENEHNYFVGTNQILVHNKAAGAPMIREFIADHPFMYYIIENQTNCILFMGKFVTP